MSFSKALKTFAPLALATLLVGCGGSKSGGGYDPNYGGPGALDRSSPQAQKLMSSVWCSDRGEVRAFHFRQSGDLHIEKIDHRGRNRRPGRGAIRGVWGLQDSRLMIQAPGIGGQYWIADNPRMSTLVLKTTAAADGMGPGALRLKSCGPAY